MNEKQQSLLLESAARFPLPKGVKLSYGTAGFRADASSLESMVFRVGILVALRSLKTGSVMGLRITTTHNQVSDNGVKVADAIANAPDPHSLLQWDAFMVLGAIFCRLENIWKHIEVGLLYLFPNITISSEFCS